jgi:HNH endonuclease
MNACSVCAAVPVVARGWCNRHYRRWQKARIGPRPHQVGPIPLAATERIWRHVLPEPNSGCWLYVGGARNDQGYGGISDGRRKVSAHRVMWESIHGLIPEGMCILHRCDVTACVNPAHLFLGTYQDNMDDAVRKGRRVRYTRAEAQEARRVRDRRARMLRSASA